MQNFAIFPIFYLPPVSYFSALKAQDFKVLLEQHEHFPKQTFRNRASIASPDGLLDLTVPVVKGSKVHTAFKDVKISYESKWQRLHWLSLQTCYRSSAYFEYYEYGIVSFYERKYDFLFDFNYAFLEWIVKQLKITPEFNLTEEYVKEIPLNQDFRSGFKKNEVHLTQTKPYFQVFSDRNPFIPNLSVVDLLFNQGPQSKNYF